MEPRAIVAPKRIRLSRAKGWRLPENAVNVARPGKWGNCYVVGRDGTRQECVEFYALLAAGMMCLTSNVDMQHQRLVMAQLERAEELRGKDLACWCALDGKPCHGDVLLVLANEPRREGMLNQFFETLPEPVCGEVAT